jgi:phospholipid/cholesterol/gamma-HCH transport system permease protein
VERKSLSAASLTGTANGERLALAALGPWTAEHAAALEIVVEETTRRYSGARSVDIDLTKLERLDTFGAWLIERLQRSFIALGSNARIVGLADADRGLIDEVRGANRTPATHAPAGNAILVGLDKIGRSVADMGWSVVLIAHMLGAVTAAVLATIAHPGRLRLTSTVYQLDRVGLRAVPIVLLTTFLIGAILAQQGILRFRTFGADAYVVDMIAVLVLREVGVLITCIMVAGRSGSAYTAELGAMKMREEIDALRTMGLDPVEVLVLPRIIALVVAVPLLTFLGSMAALYGAGLVCWLYAGMTPEAYLERLREAIWLPTFEIGLIKAPFMALMIGLVACVEGFEVDGSATSLGLKTTASVVKSIVLIFLLDGLFAVFFAGIGL